MFQFGCKNNNTNNPHGESIYNLVAKCDRECRPPRYVSRYACKVRQEAICQKKAGFQTMGIPKLYVEQPKCYLKKFSSKYPCFWKKPSDAKSNPNPNQPKCLCESCVCYETMNQLPKLKASRSLNPITKCPMMKPTVSCQGSRSSVDAKTWLNNVHLKYQHHLSLSSKFNGPNPNSLKSHLHKLNHPNFKNGPNPNPETSERCCECDFDRIDSMNCPCDEQPQRQNQDEHDCNCDYCKALRDLPDDDEQSSTCRWNDKNVTQNDGECEDQSNNRVPAGYSGGFEFIERGRKDYVRDNALAAIRCPPKKPEKFVIDDTKGHRTDSKTRNMTKKKNFGSVPFYLERRKRELCEEAYQTKLAVERANKCRPLSDENRRIIVQGLQLHWEEVFSEYQHLPLFSTSPKILKLKGSLETQLQELEKDLQLFKRNGPLFIDRQISKSHYL